MKTRLTASIAGAITTAAAIGALVAHLLDSGALTKEPSKPSNDTLSLLEVDLRGALPDLFASASQLDLETYEEIPEENWPQQLQDLGIIAIRCFDSRESPNGEGILFVVERRRDWEGALLLCNQRDNHWKGVHHHNQMMRSGPDFGFRRLYDDETYWHWFKNSWVISQGQLHSTEDELVPPGKTNALIPR